MQASEIAFVRRVLVVGGLILAVLLFWRLRQVGLLLFGAIMISILLRSLSQPLARRSGLGDGGAVTISVLALLLTLALLGGFFGWRVQAQIVVATTLMPQAFHLFIDQVRANPVGDSALTALGQWHAGAIAPALLRLPAYALGAVAIAGETGLVLVGGIYLAAQPQLYRSGLLHLVPPAARGRTGAVLDEAERGLHRWLLAQLIAMLTVGLMVGLGLWLIGVPAPAALGLLASLAEFVPFAGPLVAGAAALLLALLHGVDKAGWTLLMFVVIQSIESNLLIPLLQRRIVRLPPVLMMFSLVSFGLVFGPLGVVMAAPLTVVSVVIVRQLYLRDEPIPAKGVARSES